MVATAHDRGEDTLEDYGQRGTYTVYWDITLSDTKGISIQGVRHRSANSHRKEIVQSADRHQVFPVPETRALDS